MSLLDEVSSTLMVAGVRHALIGALALSAYGVNRATVDLYAGGLQDAWDVQQLRARPFREDLVREVETRLSELPAGCQDLWTKILQG